jgi:methylase of polypeptide subunit release factors
MEEPIYEGSHRDLFQEFLNLVEDYDAQTAALWDDLGSILTIGGGTGIVEATLLQSAPSAEVWYLDPSPEQCQTFRQ